MVKSQKLHEYLEAFHDKYLEKIKAYIPEQYRNSLLRRRHLENAKIVGYVSTLHGVGYEYRVGSSGTIKVSFGSTRVEEVIFRCPRGLMDGGISIAVRLRNS
jgi:hypothetical protein